MPPLRAARSFSDFQSGPITGFGLRGKLDFLLISGENCKEPNSGPEGNRTRAPTLARSFATTTTLGLKNKVHLILFNRIGVRLLLEPFSGG